MNEIPSRLGELDPADLIVCICHHGMRSAQVANFLERAGYASFSTSPAAPTPGRLKSTRSCPDIDVDRGHTHNSSPIRRKPPCPFHESATRTRAPLAGDARWLSPAETPQWPGSAAAAVADSDPGSLAAERRPARCRARPATRRACSSSTRRPTPTTRATWRPGRWPSRRRIGPRRARR